MTRLPATYLFVPGNRSDRFDNALRSGTDAVVLDLEDAVTPNDKPAARDAIRNWYVPEHERVAQVVIRINDETTAWFEDDLMVLRATGVRTVMLPKAEAPGQIERVLAALPEGGMVVPIIESARGALNCDSIAAAKGVHRLAFGTLDYAVDLNLPGTSAGCSTPPAAWQLHRKRPDWLTPIAGVTAALGDDERLKADLDFARACGFGAKLCIHPKQVAVVNAWFAPTATEIEWAQRVLAAAEGNQGAFQLDGKMVDRPVILKARNLLDRARK